jgi:hypothetical protein
MSNQSTKVLVLIASLSLAISACSTVTATEPGQSPTMADAVESTPTPTPTVATPTIENVRQQVYLSHNPDLSGNVGAGGEIYHLEVVGDRTNNNTSQAFLTFELSGLPSGITITDAALEFRDLVINGDPFQDLGCLRVYVDRFGEVGSGDYVVAASDDYFFQWCTEEQLAGQPVIEALAGLLEQALDTTTFQIRLQFERTSDGDGRVDAIEILEAVIMVEYLSP